MSSQKSHKMVYMSCKQALLCFLVETLPHLHRAELSWRGDVNHVNSSLTFSPGFIAQRVVY